MQVLGKILLLFLSTSFTRVASLAYLEALVGWWELTSVKLTAFSSLIRLDNYLIIIMIIFFKCCHPSRDIPTVYVELPYCLIYINYSIHPFPEDYLETRSITLLHLLCQERRPWFMAKQCSPWNTFY